jgi:peptide/nickel transport system substrate-binding protein
VAGIALPLSANAATAKIPHGGTIKVAVNSFPVNLSPINTPPSMYNNYPMEAIYGLLGYESATTGVIHLVMLKSMTPSNGFKTWALTLQPGIKFSDGTPLNAAAIEYTIKQLTNPKNAYQYLSQMQGWKMTVSSTDTLQITLPSADAQFPGEMTQEFAYIGSPTAWAAEGAAFATKPVGAGAFTLSSYTANASLTLVKNPHYYVSGEPYVNEITMNNFPTSQTQMINALTTGSDNLAWVQGQQQAGEAKAAGMQVTNYASNGGLWLNLGITHKPFNNLLARQALNLAMSHQGLANAWAPGSTAMTEVFSKSSPFYNPAYVNPPENDAQAQTDFNKLAAEGDPVDFTFTDLSGYNSIGQYVQAHLSTYKNVKVNLTTVQFGPYDTDSLTGNFQAIPNGAQYPGPWPGLANAVVTNGPLNYDKWSDPKVDAAVAALRKTTNPAAETADYNIILKEIHDQAPFFTAQGLVITAVEGATVHGYVPIEYGQMPLMEKLYIS